jgi:hypothetical protein
MRFAFLALICTAVATALLFPLPPAARAAPLRIEAEDFVASHTVYSEDLYVVDGVLYGLDYPGEWARYEVPAAGPGRYSVAVKCWGDYGTPFHMQVVVEVGSSSSQTVDLNFIGLGSCDT